MLPRCAGQSGVCGCAPGMTEEERASLEAMRAREHELESVLAAQEDTLNAHQRQVWEHQAARERMQAEWDALQGRVRPQRALLEHIQCSRDDALAQRVRCGCIAAAQVDVEAVTGVPLECWTCPELTFSACPQTLCSRTSTCSAQA